MKRRHAILLLIALWPGLAQQKRKQSANKVEVVEAKMQRSEGKITLDGLVRNVGTRPLSKLVLIFELLDADRKTISRRSGPIDEKLLPPGEEATFEFFIPDHARAVEIMVHGEQSGLEIDVVQPGPYSID
jgi:hypothetical protein